VKAQVVGIAAVERNAPAQSADASGDTVMRVQPRAKVVYKITYPNGMIYIGLDLTNTLTYMGSPSVADQIAADLGPERCQDFTIRKTILWSSTTATDAEARAMEVKLIREAPGKRPDHRLQPLARASTTTR
jgi:hypothetical protein